jgi:hypothetical protein
MSDATIGSGPTLGLALADAKRRDPICANGFQSRGAMVLIRASDGPADLLSGRLAPAMPHCTAGDQLAYRWGEAELFRGARRLPLPPAVQNASEARVDWSRRPLRG